FNVQLKNLLMDSIIKDKSYKFSLRIIEVYKYLKEKKKEFELARQILRCGTSIGANVEEAIGGQSKKDFTAKMFIAYREARETHYWIRLLRDSEFISAKSAKSLLEDCDELIKISGKIISTSRKSLIKN